MIKTKVCPICGEKFKTAAKNKRYCSFVCRAAGEKVRRMNWRDANPHYSRDYMRRYRAQKAAEDPQTAETPSKV